MPWTDDSDPGPWSKPPAKDGRRADPPEPSAARPDTAAPDTAAKDEADGPWGEARPRRRPRLYRPPARPPGDAPLGPHLDDVSRHLRHAALRLAWRGGRLPVSSLVLGLFAAAAIAWVASGLYVVAPGQTAITTRFGAYVGQAGEGLGYHLPAPIEQVRRVSTAGVERLDVAGAGGAEDLMLTADDSLAEVDFALRWRVADPARYVFASDPDAALKAEAEAAMRQAVGRTTLADLLAPAHGNVAARAGEVLAPRLARSGLGVALVEVQLQATAPAAAAAPAFHEVEAARQQARAGLVQAEDARTRAVADARADAARLRPAAVIFREQVEHEAMGEADRFALLDEQYRLAPEITRQRLYIETMEHVLRASNKVVLDPGRGVSVTLPPELFRPHPTPDQQALPRPHDRPAAPTDGRSP